MKRNLKANWKRFVGFSALCMLSYFGFSRETDAGVGGGGMVGNGKTADAMVAKKDEANPTPTPKPSPTPKTVPPAKP